jgi:tetratricopeptide (TPR) repeat protein
MARKFRLLVLLASLLFSPALVAQQQQQLSKIVGQLRVARGDFPSHQILIELQFRGSAINSAYADGDGKFGFYNLVGGEYHLIINDDAYYPVDDRLIVSPDVSGIVMALLTLRPRETTQTQDPAGARAAGSNPSLIDLGEYNKRFPKNAIKEYDKGLKADQRSSRDDAIPHYEAALKIAPDYYPAHNNLGSDYLNKSDFTNARKEFEEVVRLNQSDGAAYFNLSNVCMMTGQLADAQQYLQEGMRREPDSALGHFLLGSLEIKTGKFLEAETSLRQTIQLSPNMAQARLQLVNLFLQEGKKPEAADQLRDFVKVFPDSSFTPRARQLLQKLNPPAEASASK